jgi:hypothetical protein
LSATTCNLSDPAPIGVANASASTAAFLFCRFSLKRSFHFFILFSCSLDIIAHMHLAVAINSEIYDMEHPSREKGD